MSHLEDKDHDIERQENQHHKLERLTKYRNIDLRKISYSRTPESEYHNVEGLEKHHNLEHLENHTGQDLFSTNVETIHTLGTFTSEGWGNKMHRTSKNLHRQHKETHYEHTHFLFMSR